VTEHPERRRSRRERLRAEKLEAIREAVEDGSLTIRVASPAELEAAFGKREANGNGDDHER
jgi:hypothetical protein